MMQASVICFTLFKQEAFWPVARALFSAATHRRQDTDDGKCESKLDQRETAPPAIPYRRRRPCVVFL